MNSAFSKPGGRQGATGPIPAFQASIFLVAAAVLALGLAACSSNKEAEKKPTPKVSVIKVAPEQLPITWTYVGQTKGYRHIQIRPRVNGILLKRAYTEGSYVEKGELLFKIDPTEYKVAVKQQKGTVAQMKARLDQARRTLSRIKPLYKSGAVSGQRYDDTVSKVQIAKANLQAARATLEQAQINLGYTSISAPISGLTEQSNFSEGSLVDATQKTPLTTLIQTDPIYVYFSVANTVFLRLREAFQSGEIKTPENNKYKVKLKLGSGAEFTRTGKLDFKNNEVDPNTGTIQLRAVFPNPDGELVPNQFVRISISGAVRPHAILVPQRAVQENTKGAFVYVVDAQDKVHKKSVKTGKWHGTDWLIKEGLEPGDRVITDGFMRLRPGMKVKITSGKPSDKSSDHKADASAKSD